MKTASTALKAILNSITTDYIMADIWTFALKDGTTLNYTNADIDLVVSGTTFKHGDVLCDGGKVSWTTGLDASQDEITMYPNQGLSASMVGGVTFANAVLGGLFDRCLVTRSRLFMTAWGVTTPGAVILFVGEITNSKLTQNTIIFDSKDLRNLLNTPMPPRQYQPTCPWVFGDTNCTFNRTTIAVTSTVSSASGSTINCSLSQASGFFNNGTIKFTSGNNVGVSRSVKLWQSGTATLVAPFPVTPANGDAFTITPGCTKNFAGSTSPYSATALTGSTPTTIYTNLPQASGYFTGGTLQFTSGLNVGQIQTISAWNYLGVAILAGSFSNAPALGDVCVLTAVSTNTTNSCTGFANTSNFGGQRFLPVPETSY